MRPVSPVFPGRHDVAEVIIAEGQDEYENLPAVQLDGGVILTRWKLSFRERLVLLLTGNLFLWVWTFNRPLQPLAMSVDEPGFGETEGDEQELGSSQQAILCSS